MIPINERLNKLEVHKNKECKKCGRKYPNTILNIEGAIHHRGSYTCIDTKSCERLKRKKARK